MKKLLFILLWIGLLGVSSQAQETGELQPNLPGKIAFIGADYNVYAANFADSTTTQLTQDGSNQVRYQWPTWSPDNRLAYFCCDLQYASSLTTSAFISQDGVEPGRAVFEGQAESIIYASWSPAACSEAADCHDLALLVNDAMNGNIRIDLIRDYLDSSDDAQTIAQGAPFYYNWNPAGTQLVFHRNNRRVDVYDVSAQEVLADSQQTSSGTFQAPAWSPVDDRILAGTPGDEDRKTHLTITAGDTSQNLLSNLTGNVSFLWSPDGNYVAYRAISEGNFGALFVVDAISGEVVSRSSTSDVIAFFWSPDSQQVAYITFATPAGSFDAQITPQRQTIDFVQNTDGLAWSTLNIETGLNRNYSSFFPTSEMVYLLLYFDQFATSHHVWSPDSSYLVYSEVTTLGSQPQPVINILDVRQANSVPLTIARGVFAIWSMK